MKRERWTEWFDPFKIFDDLEFSHYGRDTEGNICMIEPDKVVLDVFPDGHVEFK